MLGYAVVFVGAGVGGTLRRAMDIWIARFGGSVVGSFVGLTLGRRFVRTALA